MATGRIVIDVERCKGCELCLPACPPSVIEMADSLNSKGYHPAKYVDLAHDCTGCALCAVVCPDGCITVYRDLPQNTSRSQKALRSQKKQRRRLNEEVLAHV